MKRLRPIALLLCLAPVPALATECRQPQNHAQLEADVRAAVNAFRSAQGLGALTPSSALQAAAQGLACDNAARKTASHIGANGSFLAGRAWKQGYRFRKVAENNARGFTSGRAVVQAWIKSPEHLANLMLPQVNEIGVGIATSAAPDGKLHWVLDMGLQR